MKTQLPPTAICIICEKKVPEARARAGTLYADGKQAFACVEHAWNKAAWLLEWVRFSMVQASAGEQEASRQRCLRETVRS